MKKINILLLFLIAASQLSAQSLYIQAFGSPTAEPLIFLHGGPGYNAAAFEASAAQSLADAGFFVICYDRRGEGRSVDAKAAYSFDETARDLVAIYKKYKLKQATLLGHSFGGMVAIKFAEKNAKKIKNIVLIGAPVNLQASFKHIRQRCTAIYTDKNDLANLKYMEMLAKMDTASMEYASFCFMHAMQNGFYSPKQASEEAQNLRENLKKSELFAYFSQMTPQPPKGFWSNDAYTTIDLSVAIKELVDAKLPIYGIYGKEDGLYAAEQVSALGRILGEGKLEYWDNCSHSVFLDQPRLFSEKIKSLFK